MRKNYNHWLLARYRANLTYDFLEDLFYMKELYVPSIARKDRNNSSTQLSAKDFIHLNFSSFVYFKHKYFIGSFNHNESSTGLFSIKLSKKHSVVLQENKVFYSAFTNKTNIDNTTVFNEKVLIHCTSFEKYKTELFLRSPAFFKKRQNNLFNNIGLLIDCRIVSIQNSQF